MFVKLVCRTGCDLAQFSNNLIWNSSFNTFYNDICVPGLNFFEWLFADTFFHFACSLCPTCHFWLVPVPHASWWQFIALFRLWVNNFKKVSTFLSVHSTLIIMFSPCAITRLHLKMTFSSKFLLSFSAKVLMRFQLVLISFKVVVREWKFRMS